MDKESMNPKEVNTEGAGKNRDEKSEQHATERDKGKAQETKPQLQEGNAIPGQKNMPHTSPGNTR